MRYFLVPGLCHNVWGSNYLSHKDKTKLLQEVLEYKDQTTKKVAAEARGACSWADLSCSGCLGQLTVELKYHTSQRRFWFGVLGFCLFLCFDLFFRRNYIHLINPRRHNLYLILRTTLHNKRDLSINRHILLKIHIGRSPMPRPYTPKDRYLYHDRGLYDQAGVQAKVWEYPTLTNRLLPCFSWTHFLILYLQAGYTSKGQNHSLPHI